VGEHQFLRRRRRGAQDRKQTAVENALQRIHDPPFTSRTICCQPAGFTLDPGRRLSYEVAALKLIEGGIPMSLHCKSTDVPEYNRTQTGEAGTGQMVVRKGYGNECSLMIATRRPGYHTKPHQHESEQINYVLDGEIWFFVKDKGYLCKKGDFHRIPANTVHWAFNRSDKDATVAEAHAPGLIGGRAGDSAAALFDEGEKPEIRGPGTNQFVPYDQEKAEAAYFSK
jgi:quercetin dioxygenase-like cupin family protein